MDRNGFNGMGGIPFGAQHGYTQTTHGLHGAGPGVPVHAVHGVPMHGMPLPSQAPLNEPLTYYDPHGMPFQGPVPILVDSSQAPFISQPVIQAPAFPSMDHSDFEMSQSKLKRRSRSFTDLMEIKQYPVYFYPYPHPSLLTQQPKANDVLESSPSPSVVNGKIAIRRAPDYLLGKPVHIVTKEEKKIAHSAMERKYRKELNLQIKKLREIVPTCSEKTGINLHKVEILKLTSEYIRQLKFNEVEEIERLQKESNSIPLDSSSDENQSELQMKIREQQQLIDQQQQLIQQLTREKIRLNSSQIKGRKSFHADDFDVNSLIDSYAGTGIEEQRS